MQRRFQYDYNALEPPDRFQFMYFRGLALNLITWMSCNYRVVDVGDAGRPLRLKNVAGLFLACQATAILNYKVRAVQAEYKGFPNCDTSDIKRQLELLFAKGILGQVPTIFSEESVGRVHMLSGNPNHFRLDQRHDPSNFEGEIQNFHYIILSVLTSNLQRKIQSPLVLPKVTSYSDREASFSFKFRCHRRPNTASAAAAIALTKGTDLFCMSFLFFKYYIPRNI